MKDYYCPLLKKKCIGSKCAWHTTMRGTNPNTGGEVDSGGCVIAFLPMLLVENSQQQRSTAAATESFRDEMIKSHQSDQQVLMAAAQMFMNPQLKQSDLNN